MSLATNNMKNRVLNKGTKMTMSSDISASLGVQDRVLTISKGQREKILDYFTFN